MSARTLAARRLISTAGLALLVVTGGCTRMLNSGLARPGGGQYTSTYLYKPSSEFPTGMSLVQPHSVASSLPNLLSGQSPTGPLSCHLSPNGAARVLPMTSGATGTPLLDLGGTHIGIAGTLVPPIGLLRALFTGDGVGFAQEARAANARMSTDGSWCERSLFLYVRLGSSSSAQPASALR